jgi:signal recognition particle GTPase
MNTGILLDIRNEASVDLAKKIQREIKNNGDNSVIFYSNICQTKEPFDTAVMSKNSIWSFSGNLICLSIDLTKEATEVPSKIKVFYMPDADSFFDPLYLLLINKDVTVACADKEMKTKLTRTIGSNRNIVFEEDIAQLVRSIL